MFEGKNIVVLDKANGIPGKTGDGAQAPRDWQAGKISDVVNYCQDDVLKTRQLFELLVTQHGVMQRSNGPIQIGLPKFSQEESA